MIKPDMIVKLLKEVDRLIYNGFDSIDIKIVDEGFLINPTKTQTLNKEKSNGN